MLDCVLALLAHASCASGKIMLQCLFIFFRKERAIPGCHGHFLLRLYRNEINTLISHIKVTSDVGWPTGQTGILIIKCI